MYHYQSIKYNLQIHSGFGPLFIVIILVTVSCKEPLSNLHLSLTPEKARGGRSIANSCSRAVQIQSGHGHSNGHRSMLLKLKRLALQTPPTLRTVSLKHGWMYYRFRTDIMRLISRPNAAADQSVLVFQSMRHWNNESWMARARQCDPKCGGRFN